MKNILLLILLGAISSCTTIHFRSKNTIPVTFDGNPQHRQEISVIGHRHFYFWGIEPDHHVVYIDEELRKSGYDGVSKLIVYEHKNPQDILISFLTLGFYMPRGFTISGFASGEMLPEEQVENTTSHK